MISNNEYTKPVPVGEPVITEESKDIEKPYNVDDDNLHAYYKGLSEADIEEVVELMKVASVRELFTLIAGDCQKYISVIEHYKKENLQTLCNVCIRRIEGHLLVKFRLNSNDRWVEVGFFDDCNTDRETLSELKTMVAYHLKNYDEIGKQRRTHIASQFDDGGDAKDYAKGDAKGDSKEKSRPVTKVVPDYFNPNDNPELKITERQKESAGYLKLPENSGDIMKQIKSSETFSLSKFEDKAHVETVKEKKKEPEVHGHLDNFKAELKKQLNVSPMGIECLKNMLSSEDVGLLDNYVGRVEYVMNLLSLLRNSSGEKSVFLYKFVTDIVSRQEPMMLVDIIVKLMNKNDAISSLTGNQIEIIKKYGVNLGDL
jgi:hypothetical protein